MAAPGMVLSDGAAMCLAGVLEHVAAEVLSRGCDNAQKRQSDDVTADDTMRAILADPEINRSTMNIRRCNGGNKEACLLRLWANTVALADRHCAKR